ncbi:respiratory supercomplex assembly factor RCF1 NDAI_0C00820 [Naumovozyma dairenensis CBS 421]|uniref:Respiratory supercomplex factor 1, mitochondrial n=1 Tax=Naumovozyma dairenensis (strain ATCC 10597 / BCRC 20456 / CBS 421 / NBRC 0211 / NRRL Y-12639) TaxID=1071378 RepID=G0W7I2_NAUDC|nr:hypothetical protein NDAI_0C00820 [Naumovozyma dairenensis CBS 421]CCD23743.1 hypothetical protein NDAI_0C00820 [Naumovozyma dairenensis CBS 421]
MSSIPSSFDPKRGEALELEEMPIWDKIVFHCKREPLVPIGALLTTGAVILAAQNVRIGNQVRAQHYFRWRVGLQGATLVALVTGSYLYGTTSAKAIKSKEDELKEKAKRREQLWIQELERRDQEIKDRRLKAEVARKKTVESEESIKDLETELADLESKLHGSSTGK